MTNPYRAPQGLSPGEGTLLDSLVPGARATLVARGMLLRRIVVEAPVEMTLEFNGRSLFDRVLVNGHPVARRTSWWRITPRLDFVLSVGPKHVNGCVEVRVWPWLALRGFRVTIADRVVYAEGTFQREEISSRSP
jgi:hypothetical protein